MGRFDAFQKNGARAAGQDRFEPGTQRFVPHAAQTIQLVEQFLHGFDDRVPLVRVKYGQRIGRWTVDCPPCGGNRPADPLPDRAIRTVYAARPGGAPRPTRREFRRPAAAEATRATAPAPIRWWPAPRWQRRTRRRDSEFVPGRPACAVSRSSNCASAPRNVRILILSKCSAANSSASELSTGGFRPAAPTEKNRKRRSAAPCRSYGTT